MYGYWNRADAIAIGYFLLEMDCDQYRCQSRDILELITKKFLTIILLCDGPVMGLLPDTKNCGLRMRRDAGNVFPATEG